MIPQKQRKGKQFAFISNCRVLMLEGYSV